MRGSLPSQAISSERATGCARSGTTAGVRRKGALLWGFRDIAFREKELERWQSALSDARVLTFEDCGHFLAEEAPERVLPALREFMPEAPPSG